MARVLGSPQGVLSAADVERFVRSSLEEDGYTGKKVCVLVPDATRSCPLPALLDGVYAALHGRVAELTFMVALGTHPAMDEERLGALLGHPPGRSAERYP